MQSPSAGMPPIQNQTAAGAHTCESGKICDLTCSNCHTHRPNPLCCMPSSCKPPCSPYYDCCTQGRTNRPSLPEILATRGGVSCRRLHSKYCGAPCCGCHMQCIPTWLLADQALASQTEQPVPLLSPLVRVLGPTPRSAWRLPQNPGGPQILASARRVRSNMVQLDAGRWMSNLLPWAASPSTC